MLAILYAIFISLFALDMIQENVPITRIIAGLAIHLIPTFVSIVATIIAWKKQLLGGIVFLVLAILTIFFFNTAQHVASFVIVTMPLFVIGGLFLLDHKIRSKNA